MEQKKVFILFISAAIAFGVHADAPSCTYTDPLSNSVFDLSPLQKMGSADYTKVSENHVYKFYMNVCGHTDQVPPECMHSHSKHPSVAYQSGHGWCYWLGALHTQKWNLIDDIAPEKGIELVYTDGQMCANGKRQVHYHFICAEGFAGESIGPSFTYEYPACHYHFVWPTAYGCPVKSSSSWIPHGTSLIFTAVLMYMLIGFVANVVMFKMPVAISSLPHLSLLARLVGGVVALITAPLSLCCASRKGSRAGGGANKKGLDQRALGKTETVKSGSNADVVFDRFPMAAESTATEL